MFPLQLLRPKSVPSRAKNFRRFATMPLGTRVSMRGEHRDGSYFSPPLARSSLKMRRTSRDVTPALFG
jgi:hypothetical protein